jgi:putative (di)nucleoside polyphosphate hydrolase
VVYFKRHVYQQALEELAPALYPDGVPERTHVYSGSYGFLRQRYP